MGEAIIASSLKHFFVHVSESDPKRQEYLRLHYKLISYDLTKLTQISDLIILAVKPQDIDGVLKELSKIIRKEMPVISIAAGITTGFIENILGKDIRVVRTMPNMPALVNQGMTAVCAGQWAKKEDVVLALLDAGADPTLGNWSKDFLDTVHRILPQILPQAEKAVVNYSSKKGSRHEK